MYLYSDYVHIFPLKFCIFTRKLFITIWLWCGLLRRSKCHHHDSFLLLWFVTSSTQSDILSFWSKTMRSPADAHECVQIQPPADCLLTQIFFSTSNTTLTCEYPCPPAGSSPSTAWGLILFLIFRLLDQFSVFYFCIYHLQNSFKLRARKTRRESTQS